MFSLLFLVLTVNHDLRGGTAPDPLVWSVGARPERRRLVHAVRDRFFFRLGRLVFGIRNGFLCLLVSVCAADVAHWPYTPGLLVKWVAFLWYSSLACCEC